MSQKERNRPGRNDPCPCGSGYKYKKCCLLAIKTPVVQPIPAAIQDKIKKYEQGEEVREKLYGKVRPIIHTNFKGFKIVAVGNQVNWAKEEDIKTFPDFLMHYMGTALGADWGNAEIRKPLEERHQILKWYDEVCRFQQRQDARKDGLYEAVPNGAFAAYLSLAYDLYILRHHNKIQENVIQRLKHPDQFQGARYELFSAATCIRAGFEIEYEDEGDESKKHPEFVITHLKTGQKISIEAKSRHRRGVLDYPGQPETSENIKLGIVHLVNRAVQKITTHPFFVFVDINLPASLAERIMAPPFDDVLKEIEHVAKAEDGSLPYNLILITNHPHHYGGEDENDPGKRQMSVVSTKPKISLPNQQYISDIMEAASQYGRIPNEFPKD